MKPPAIITQLALVLNSYDKRHHRNASFDSLGSLLSILFTTFAWFLLTAFAPDIPTSYYSIASGIVRGMQLYFGIVLFTSLLGYLFDTFSPYRHVFASLAGVIALSFCLVTRLNHVLPPPEFFGMAITLAFACYTSASNLIRILVTDSTFAAKWRELSGRD